MIFGTSCIMVVCRCHANAGESLYQRACNVVDQWSMPSKLSSRPEKLCQLKSTKLTLRTWRMANPYKVRGTNCTMRHATDE